MKITLPKPNHPIRIFLLIFFISFGGFSFAQKKKEKDKLDPAKIDAYIQNAMDEFGQEGLAVGIVKGNELIYSRGFGKLDAAGKAPVTPQSVFALASLSKAFTVAAIGLLVDEGKLEWSDKVIDHLPWFSMHDPYVTREMTLRDLLSHRVGLNTFDGDLLWYGTSYSAEEVVRRIRFMPPKQEFRSKYGYQNVMYMAAALIIGQKSGMNWFDFVQTRLLNPLGMKSSSTGTSGLLASKELALPHVKGVSMSPQDFDNCPGAVGVNSSVEDLSKWIRFWLQAGIFEEKTILSSAAINLALTPHVNFSSGSNDLATQTHFRAYGMGWGMKDYYGKKIINHSGGLPGYILNLVIVPEENLGIVVLTNGESILPFAVTNYLLDTYLAPEVKDYATEYLGYEKTGMENLENQAKDRRDVRKEGTQPSLSLADYAGDYTDKMYGPARITESEKGLKLELTPSKALFTSEMEHWHHDTFRIKFKDPFLPEGFVTFSFNTNGQVTGFTIDLPNPDFHFTNLKFERDE